MAPGSAGAGRCSRGRHQHGLARGADRRHDRRRRPLRPAGRLFARRAAATMAARSETAGGIATRRCPARRCVLDRLGRRLGTRLPLRRRCRGTLRRERPASASLARAEPGLPSARRLRPRPRLASDSPRAPAPTASAGPTPTSPWRAPRCSLASPPEPTPRSRRCSTPACASAASAPRSIAAAGRTSAPPSSSPPSTPPPTCSAAPGPSRPFRSREAPRSRRSGRRLRASSAARRPRPAGWFAAGRGWTRR